jgi:hypothetical protein
MAVGTPSLVPIPDVTLKPGESKVLKIAVNRNGYEGPINVSFTGLPDKVTVSAAVIAPDQSAVQVKLTAAADATEENKAFRVVAAANKRTAQSEVQLTVAVPPSLVVLPIKAMTLKPGEERAFEVKVDRKKVNGPVAVTIEGLPDNVNAPGATIPASQSTVKIKLTAGKDAPDDVKKQLRVVATAYQLKAEGSVQLIIPKVPADPKDEATAKVRLKRAKQLYETGDSAKVADAKKRLHEIIKEFPRTKAAVEARTILKLPKS